MEVGAVKQAFNNEVIHLKKKLNQAKIQLIHKLTRKAKTLVEKKAPDPLKEKFKRKAEGAVKEVLILKKIKPKDLAKFIVTHKGELKDHLNKPNVDIDKACARLSMHKSLQDKYEFIRSRFSNVPIDDLLMSRLERQKLKKEEKELQKNKKKAKEERKKKAANISVCSDGDWNVEDINIPVNVSSNSGAIENKLDSSDGEGEEVEQDEDELNMSDEGGDDEKIVNNDEVLASDDDNEDDKKFINNDEVLASDDDNESNDTIKRDVTENKIGQEQNKAAEISVKLKPNKANKKVLKKEQLKEDNRAKLPKINKERNKKIDQKISGKKFKKDSVNNEVTQASKVVDPFFITTTGESYMTLAEPRAPDEVKEVHKQGNRKLRRAVMFGNVIKGRPRQDFRNNNHDNFTNNDRFGKQNNYNNSFNKNFEGRNKYDNNTFNKFDGRSKGNNFDRESSFINKDSKPEVKDAVPEKLHPSWEAKKKISSILPFQGKKTVFGEE